MSTPGTSSGAAMGSSNSKSISEGNVAKVENAEQDSQVVQSVLDLRALCRQFYTHCRNPLCNRVLRIDDDLEHIEEWRAGAKTIPPTSHLSAWACQQCKTATCVGCNYLPALNAKSLFTPLGVINHCCDLGRLFTIYFLLCRFDDSQIKPEKKSEPKSKPKKKTPVKGKGSAVPGIGYASGYESVAYGGWGGMMVDEIDDIDFPSEDAMYAYQFHSIMPKPFTPTDDEDKKEKDALMIETLRLIGPCLPDASSPALVESNLFRLGMFFDHVTDLIRNDSISDVTERAELYMELIDFVKAVADIPALAGLLFEERPEKSRSPGLRTLGNPVIQDASVPEISSTSRSASVFSSSKNIYEQVKVFLKLAAKKTLGGPSTQTPVNPLKKETMKLCESVLELHDYLKTRADAEASARPRRPVTLDEESDEYKEAEWAKFQEENRVTFTDEVLVAHRYTTEMANVKTSVAKNRLSTISKEIATLTTSLPAGIFLKIAESRSDVMKVMIVGSEGSPYAGGLFIFDIFLPAEYPLTPPKMAFVLDGNDSDTYSFNPNLHVGGGVCLSILNTWSGMPQEMWQPNKSTLLAVLVSVQAMILGAPFPWHNEPGHENEGESTQVKENKKVVQTKTIRHAMIAWKENTFDNSNAKEHIWEEISRKYFSHNRKKILAEVVEWVPDNKYLLEFSPNLPFPFGPKKGRHKIPSTSSVPPVNLVNKLATILCLPQPFPNPDSDDEDDPKKKKGLLGKLNSLKGKRKVSTEVDIAHHLKKQKSEDSNSFEQKWVYTGAVNQKESRAACKEFGIGAASSIKATIGKLEKHVNEKGKAAKPIMEKWGKMVYVEEPDLEASSAGSSFPGSFNMYSEAEEEDIPDHMTMAPWVD